MLMSSERGLAARWMRILWICWTRGVTYDPALHRGASAHTAAAA